MRKIISIVLFYFFISGASAATDSIAGKWRGTIIGHTDNKDYFLNADISPVKNDEYAVKLKIFSGDYAGEFLVNTTLKNGNRLYINSFQKLSEFPFSFQHIEDCFTGFFMIKKGERNLSELDLYRNPIYRNIDDFTSKDSAGNFVPAFECFTSVLLRSVKYDTTYAQLEKQTDSLIASKKKRIQEVAKRKVVSSKEWSVKSEKVTLQVWDNNKEDGDIISLKFNDTWILTNFLLKKEKYTIHLELKDKNNQLLLFAENLGSIPPNTAAISIDDNVLVRTFILNSDMSKSETVKIMLDKPVK